MLLATNNGGNVSLKFYCLLALLTLSGCSPAIVKQNVTPFNYDKKEVCIIENPKVSKENFLNTYVSALKNKAYKVRVLKSDAKVDHCEVTSTYTARWRWDLALYLSYARLDVYLDGTKEAEALYTIVRDGASGKFINAAEKVQELVNELYPANNNYGTPTSSSTAKSSAADALNNLADSAGNSETPSIALSKPDASELNISGRYASEIIAESAKSYFKKGDRELILTQHGKEVEGIFGSRGKGKIWGQIEGNKVTFDWISSGGDDGLGEWIIDAENLELRGRWTSSSRNRYGKWNLKKIE